MFKLFTLQGATRILPEVDSRLETLLGAIRDLEEAQARARGMRWGTAEAWGTREELAFLLRSVRDARSELAGLGVQIPDLEAGIVEFPARIGGEVVHLVWERGQDAITRYHRLTGDPEPLPLAGTAERGA